MDRTTALIDYLSYNPDTGEIHWIKSNSNKVKTGDLAGSIDDKGYIRIQFNRKLFRAHQIAWLLTYGVLPNNQIDHINGIRNDNRIKNLRNVTNRENQLNLNCHRQGRLPGTCFSKYHGKWKAQIQINSIQYFLGYFNTELEAHECYINALKELQ